MIYRPPANTCSAQTGRLPLNTGPPPAATGWTLYKNGYSESVNKDAQHKSVANGPFLRLEEDTTEFVARGRERIVEGRQDI